MYVKTICFVNRKYHITVYSNWTTVSPTEYLLGSSNGDCLDNTIPYYDGDLLQRRLYALHTNNSKSVSN